MDAYMQFKLADGPQVRYDLREVIQNYEGTWKFQWFSLKAFK